MKTTIILTALLVVSSCSSKPKDRGVVPPLLIEVITSELDTIPTTMEFACQTYSLYDIDLVPRVSGYLLSVGYTEGMAITKGQLLLAIEPSEYIESVEEARATLASAKATLINAENSYNRYLPLWERKAISRSTLDAAVAELAEARAAVNSAKASLRNSKTDLSYTKLYAPFDGVIGKTNGAVGEYVGTGTLYERVNTISNVDSLYVYLSIPTKKYLEIIARDSLPRELYSDSEMLHDIVMYLSTGEEHPHKGKYKFTQRAINSSTGSVVFSILFANPTRTLRSGEYVKVCANVGSPRSTVVVPSRCVMQNQGSGGVFIVDSLNTVRYCAVTLGENFGDKWEITSGLTGGETVLYEGLQKVHSGEKITPKLIKM